MAGLGTTLTQSGDLPLAETTVASAVYSTDELLVSDQDNLTLWASSQRTDSLFAVLSEEPGESGPMPGLELGGRVRLEPADRALFVQTGVHYSQRIAGGTQERTLGDIATSSAQLSAVLTASGLDPADYVFGHLTTTLDARQLEIPLSVGLRSQPRRGLSQIYGSAGLSVVHGGYQLTIDADERYANALATHLDAETDTATSYSPGAVSETLDFSITAVGLCYGLGLQVSTSDRLAWFIELNSTAATRTATAPLSASASQLLSAAQSARQTAQDPEWFSAISRSVTLTGAAVRVGARRYVR